MLCKTGQQESRTGKKLNGNTISPSSALQSLVPYHDPGLIKRKIDVNLFRNARVRPGLWQPPLQKIRGQGPGGLCSYGVVGFSRIK